MFLWRFFQNQALQLYESQTTYPVHTKNHLLQKKGPGLDILLIFSPHTPVQKWTSSLSWKRFWPIRLAGVQGTKRKGEEPTHSSPKSVTFSKEYNTPALFLQWIASPFQGSQWHSKNQAVMRLRNNVANQSQANTERSGYATPINLQATASYCLIPCVWNCRSFS